MGTEFPFGKTGKVLEMDGSDGRGTTLMHFMVLT